MMFMKNKFNINNHTALNFQTCNSVKVMLSSDRMIHNESRDSNGGNVRLFSAATRTSQCKLRANARLSALLYMRLQSIQPHSRLQWRFHNKSLWRLMFNFTHTNNARYVFFHNDASTVHRSQFPSDNAVLK